MNKKNAVSSQVISTSSDLDPSQGERGGLGEKKRAHVRCNPKSSGQKEKQSQDLETPYQVSFLWAGRASSAVEEEALSWSTSSLQTDT